MKFVTGLAYLFLSAWTGYFVFHLDPTLIYTTPVFVGVISFIFGVPVWGNLSKLRKTDITYCTVMAIYAIMVHNHLIEQSDILFRVYYALASLQALYRAVCEFGGVEND
jgi:hypothetical protein